MDAEDRERRSKLSQTCRLVAHVCPDFFDIVLAGDAPACEGRRQRPDDEFQSTFIQGDELDVVTNTGDRTGLL